MSARNFYPMNKQTETEEGGIIGTPKTDAVKIACGFQAVPEQMLQHARELERECMRLRKQLNAMAVVPDKGAQP